VNPNPPAQTQNCPFYGIAFEVPAKKYTRINGFSWAERKRMREKSASWRDENPDNGGGWNGHLVVFVGDRWLIDPSIDQADSREFSVAIPPEILVIDLAGRDWTPQRDFAMKLGLRLDNGDEAKLIYRRIRNRNYLDTEAWNDEGLPLLALAIADRMRSPRIRSY
jgi:hypothetical protein